MTAFTYHPPTVDSLDIAPSEDGLAVYIGIYNTTDNGTYTRIEVMNRDLEDVITALRAAAAPVEAKPSIDQARLYGTTDAAVWAEEFAKFAPDVDEGVMIGWFANAFETAKVHARSPQVSTPPAGLSFGFYPNASRHP